MMNPPKNQTPWDARIARWMLYPVSKNRFLHPNLFTTFRLLTGSYGATLFMLEAHMSASLLFVLSNFLDHFDGELARMTNRSSRFGHFFDLFSDFVVTTGTFFCIGLGFYLQTEQNTYIFMGAITGISIMAIFHMRHLIEESEGKAGTAQPNAFGFEAEDILYLLPLVVAFECLEKFMMLASVGAPIATFVVLKQLVNVRKKRGTAS